MDGIKTANELREKSAVQFKEAAQRPLVSELFAIRGEANQLRIKRMADRSGLPLTWLDQIPGTNGETGLEKLLCERSILLLRNRKSSFIEQFRHPIGRCAKFYKLTAYNSCNFWCEYCYLYLTFRNQPVSTHFVNYEKMYEEIEKFDKSTIPKRLRVLNLGELGDPLAVDYITGFAREVVSFTADNAKNTRLLFLTKSDCVNDLLQIDHQGRTIISFSINTNEVFEQLEHRTASPYSRLAAAAKVARAGYEVRIRIDPVIFYSTWQEDYVSLVDKIYEFVQPTRITIGEYRPSSGLGNHIGNRFPESPLLRTNKGLVREGGKLRYPKGLRIEMFSAIINAIKKHDSNVQISLCKENADIWRALHLNQKGLRCNCLG